MSLYCSTRIFDVLDWIDDMFDIISPCSSFMFCMRLRSFVSKMLFDLHYHHNYFISSCSYSIIFRYWISLSTNLCFIIPIQSSNCWHLSFWASSQLLSYLHLSWQSLAVIYDLLQFTNCNTLLPPALLEAEPFLLALGLKGRFGFSNESLSSILTSSGVLDIKRLAISCIFYRAVWLR